MSLKFDLISQFYALLFGICLGLNTGGSRVDGRVVRNPVRYFLPRLCAAMMENSPPPISLLEELDRRQDEVLAQLDELDARLNELLSEYSGGRPHPLAPMNDDAA
jgi:hypothetical protein